MLLYISSKGTASCDHILSHSVLRRGVEGGNGWHSAAVVARVVNHVLQLAVPTSDTEDIHCLIQFVVIPCIRLKTGLLSLAQDDRCCLTL